MKPDRPPTLYVLVHVFGPSKDDREVIAGGFERKGDAIDAGEVLRSRRVVSPLNKLDAMTECQAKGIRKAAEYTAAAPIRPVMHIYWNTLPVKRGQCVTHSYAQLGGAAEGESGPCKGLALTYDASDLLWHITYNGTKVLAGTGRATVPEPVAALTEIHRAGRAAADAVPEFEPQNAGDKTAGRKVGR